MKKKSKKVKLLKGEKAMYVLLLFLLITIPVFNVFTSSMLSETNNEVEKITKNIERQELTNQGLSMQIDELASLENIQTIAENHGLSYNNSNIKYNKEGSHWRNSNMKSPSISAICRRMQTAGPNSSIKSAGWNARPNTI